MGDALWALAWGWQQAASLWEKGPRGPGHRAGLCGRQHVPPKCVRFQESCWGSGAWWAGAGGPCCPSPGAPRLPRSEARAGGSSRLPPVPGAWLALMDGRLWLCPAYRLTRPWGSSLQPLSAVPGHPHTVLRPLCSRVGPLEPCLSALLRRCAFLSPDSLPSTGSSPPSALLDLFLKNSRVSAAGCGVALSPALGPLGSLQASCFISSLLGPPGTPLLCEP